MSFSRPQRHRTDGNQSPLIELFESLGGYWIPYASKPFDGWAWHPRWVGGRYFEVGNGVWDARVMAGYMPVEIKQPERKNHADRYTKRQKKIMDEMRKRGAVWLEWEVDSDVYACVGARRTA